MSRHESKKERLSRLIDEWNNLSDDQKIELMRVSPTLYAATARFVRYSEARNYLSKMIRDH